MHRLGWYHLLNREYRLDRFDGNHRFNHRHWYRVNMHRFSTNPSLLLPRFVWYVRRCWYVNRNRLHYRCHRFHNRYHWSDYRNNRSPTRLMNHRAYRQKRSENEGMFYV
jgi:hypothetical protein